jgi:anti-sigma factor RsiW
MTNDPNYDHFRELSWRRELTGAEDAQLHAWLAAHPEAQADWEAEAGLNAALGRLPDVPVPGNFTARVLQAAEREAAAERRRSGWIWGGWPRLRWLPKAAFAAVILGAGLVSYHQFQAARLREYVSSVAAVSDVSSLPGPEILKDFDAIRASNPTPLPDEQLLADLQYPQ